MAKGERLAAKAAKEAERAARPPERLVVKRTIERQCPECARLFVVHPGHGAHKTFCQTLCRDRFSRRSERRGKVLMPYALAWRVGRNSKKIKDNEMFREMISILDIFAEEDRKAGRPNIGDYAARMLATGFTYMDRRRS